jgi:type II secretory pathway pseudopilin PulG
LRPQKLYKTQKSEAGFSLVEVLIAAIILFIILASANKALMLGMAGTRQGTSRTTLETQILNDIETIQGIDSGLSSASQQGCAGGGSSYLKAQIQAYFNTNPPSKPVEWQRTLDSSDPTILTITYSFAIPESTSRNGGAGSTGIEKRVLEISPSFLSECPAA